MPGRPRRLLHLRGRHRRRLRRAARPDRLQAGGDGRDRRVGGDGLRVPGDRRAPRAPRTPSPGSPSPGGSTAGAPRRWRDGDAGVTPARRSARPARRHGARAQPPPARPASARADPGAQPGGRHAIAVGLDADYEVEIEGHVGYYCAGMNKRATVRVRGNCGVGVAENMMSGPVVVDGWPASPRARRPRRPARHPRRRRRRGAASRSRAPTSWSAARSAT